VVGRNRRTLVFETDFADAAIVPRVIPRPPGALSTSPTEPSTR
jgi:hypothetical protein